MGGQLTLANSIRAVPHGDVPLATGLDVSGDLKDRFSTHKFAKRAIRRTGHNDCIIHRCLHFPLPTIVEALDALIEAREVKEGHTGPTPRGLGLHAHVDKGAIRHPTGPVPVHPVRDLRFTMRGLPSTLRTSN